MGQIGIALALAACSAACSATTPERAAPRVTEPRIFSGSAPRGVAMLRQAMLTTHNDARAAVRAAPLAWDETLAADAGRYARELARTRIFQHSGEPRGAVAEGENLWTGTRGAYTYAEMAGHWIDERRFYKVGVTPAFSTTGRWQDVAHYTQLIWHRTSAFGCAMASTDRDDYLVCRYTLPGNVVGQVP